MTDLITYYKSEDMHPRLAGAFDWFDENVLQYIGAGANKDNVILAGGALRSYFTDTPVRDYDIYGILDQLNIGVTFGPHLSQGDWGLVSETDLSWTYRRLSYDPLSSAIDKRAFNIIKKPAITPQAVIQMYDFTVCMCAITNEMITYHPDYFTDLATKALRINNPDDNLATLWRLQKYVKLGYTIGREDLWKIAESIHDLNDLPRIIKETEDKSRISLKENVKTLAEVFRSS